MFRLFGKLIKVGIVAFLLLIGLGLLLSQGRSPQATVASDPPRPTAPPPVEAADSRASQARTGTDVRDGDEAVLDVPGNRLVFLATDEGWDEMLDAENAEDTEELMILIRRRKVFAELNGTRVKVLKLSFASIKVRIREGNNPGAEGWVQRGFVRLPLPSDTAQPVAAPVAENDRPKPPMKVTKPKAIPDPARSALDVARNLDKSNKQEAALAAYKEVIKNFPGTPQAEYAEKRVEALGKK